MMIKKVDISFLGGDKGAKTSGFGAILRFKPLICQENFISEKNQKIHQVTEQFSGSIFGHNFFPRSLWLQFNFLNILSHSARH